MIDAWLPKSVILLRRYSGRAFAADAVAGVTVGLVALPLAMAFAISSGVKPESGLYCAIVAGFLISALGGSRFQVGGPTGAFVVVVANIVATYGLDGLFMCTMMAGVLLIVLGATGMGSAVKFIPRPVVVGFTNGIGVLIASTQIKDFLGLRVETPSAFWPRMVSISQNLGTYSGPATALAATSLVTLIVWRRMVPKVPGYIVALLAGTASVAVLQLPVETIGTRFGGIPAGWPVLTVPTFRPDLIGVLFRPALTVAMLGALESLMSAVVADRMGGDRHNPNVELVAQGIANVASPLFGGLPATGAIARTATNIRSGAQTPVSGIVHSLTLLSVLLVAAPLARFIPLSVLAAILLVVSYSVGDWGEIPELLKLTKTDISVWVVTFALTVFADLTLAVETGMILAMLLFIRKVSQTTTVSLVTPEYVEAGRVHILQDKKIPDYVSVFRIHGPLLFGVTDKIARITEHVDDLAPIVIVRLRNMTAIDSTGLRALEDLADSLHAAGRELILCGAPKQPAALMRQSEFHQHVGADNICPNITIALERSTAIRAASPHAPPQAAPHPVSIPRQ
ncbi:MAG TPA: SulP family inorganic anion transporter [Vicinamibacterales bacterium]|jgi:SulP family sulfate permease|nr:SulP family inorganic anion transporter [Vicinamibacterales bacterium]